MEYVKGVPITEYCDATRLSVPERLNLFVEVCQAVQHAHQKGIIHRDLKPSNILVAPYDDKPVPKVIDFGLAKAMHQSLTERTLHTAHETVLGTPLYMSPEQAQLNNLDVDTRSDVYSLGVLLYELLTGTTPLEKQRFKEAAWDEIKRIIREEEPPRPSTRLSSTNTLPSLDPGRQIALARLTKLVRGELDWIVMKSLEKDRSRRYDTANGFARDIQRYLAGEPVLAVPPSARYQLVKFARKHRVALTTAAVIGLLLVAGVAVSTWQAVRATRAETRAVEERDAKELARKDADAARQKAESFVKRLREATALTGRGLLFSRQRRWGAAHAAFAEAERLEPGVLTIYVFRGWMYVGLGLWDLAADDELKVTKKMGAGRDSGDSYQCALLRLNVGDEPSYREVCRSMLDRFGDATDNLDTLNLVRACALSPTALTDTAALARQAEKVASTEQIHWHLYITGVAHYRAGQYEQAVERLRKSATEDPDWIARAINYPVLAMAFHRLGKADEARQALASAEKAIDGWTEAMVHGPVGTMPIPWFDWLECLHFYREANKLIRGRLPADDPRLRAVHERALGALTNGDAFEYIDRGRVHARRGEWDQATAQFGQALDLLPADLLGPSTERKLTPICNEMVPHPEVFARLIGRRPRDARLWVARGRTFARKGEWDNAAADFGKAVELEPDDPWHWYRLALSHLGAGRLAEYRRTCAAMLERLGKSDDFHVLARIVYTCVYVPDAVCDSGILAGMADRAVKEGAPIHLRGAALCRAGEFAEALPALDRAIEEGRPLCKPWEWLFAALAHGKLGHREEARGYLEKSRIWIEEADHREAKPGSELWLDPYQPVEVKQLYREVDALIAAKVDAPKAP